MNPYDAYVNTAKTNMSDRELEAAALTRAAHLLQTCQQNWDALDRPRKLAEALEFNQKLWSIFEVSLAAPDHPLTPALRQDILNLGLFIDARIFEVMADPALEKLTAIIQISQNLAAGLRVGVGDAMNRELSAAGPETVPEEPVWA